MKQEVADLGHVKSVFYRFKDLKMNVDYIIPVIHGTSHLRLHGGLSEFVFLLTG